MLVMLDHHHHASKDDVVTGMTRIRRLQDDVASIVEVMMMMLASDAAAVDSPGTIACIIMPSMSLLQLTSLMQLLQSSIICLLAIRRDSYCSHNPSSNQSIYDFKGPISKPKPNRIEPLIVGLINSLSVCNL
jgi:hypothetical protein